LRLKGNAAGWETCRFFLAQKSGVQNKNVTFLHFFTLFYSFFVFFSVFCKKSFASSKKRFTFATSNLPSTPMQKSKCGKKYTP